MRAIQRLGDRGLVALGRGCGTTAGPRCPGCAYHLSLLRARRAPPVVLHGPSLPSLRVLLSGRVARVPDAVSPTLPDLKFYPDKS
jgi:hypothetical protein